MNEARLSQLSSVIGELEYKWLSSLKRGFNMDGFTVRGAREINCNTACCIAGWAVALFGDDEMKRDVAGAAAHATKLLGLDPHVSFDLFFNDAATPEMASRALRRLADGVDYREMWDD